MKNILLFILLFILIIITINDNTKNNILKEKFSGTLNDIRKNMKKIKKLTELFKVVESFYSKNVQINEECEGSKTADKLISLWETQNGSLKNNWIAYLKNDICNYDC